MLCLSTWPLATLVLQALERIAQIRDISLVLFTVGLTYEYELWMGLRH